MVLDDEAHDRTNSIVELCVLKCNRTRAPAVQVLQGLCVSTRTGSLNFSSESVRILLRRGIGAGKPKPRQMMRFGQIKRRLSLVVQTLKVAGDLMV